jgi:hypothetical protein
MKATEQEWLEYFFANVDFGPAHEDVVDIIAENFVTETGKTMPEGYEDCRYAELED